MPDQVQVHSSQRKVPIEKVVVPTGVRMQGITQNEQSSLIHRAATYGELDTLTDLIEEKGTDPCLIDHVSTQKNLE